MMKNIYMLSLFFLVLCTGIAYAQAPQQPAGTSLEEQNKKLLEEEEALLKKVQNELSKSPGRILPSPTPTSEPAPIEQKTEAKPIAEVKNNALAKTSSSICIESLAAAEGRIKKLVSDLEETRNRLMLSETEVERLAKIVDGRSTNIVKAVEPAKQKASLSPTDIVAQAASDMPIATVSMDNTHLRSGPSLGNSSLMTVAKGTRLAVETRSGDWYRVIAPNGSRAWVSSESLDFGGGGRNSAGRIRGVVQDEEEMKAFENVSKRGLNN